MKLLDEIITLSTDDKEPMSNILRKCLVLAHEIKNDRFKHWVEKELDGYDTNTDDIPNYRCAAIRAKGTLFGPFGGVINDQPLSPHVLDENVRHWATDVRLGAPIAAYEKSGATEEVAIIEWPASLVARYQSKFMQGWALNRAWIEIPGPFIRALMDSVRNRVLRLALELKSELGGVNERPEKLEPEEVDRQVSVIIYGGQNIIGSSAQQIVQQATSTVVENDINSLVSAFQQLGFGKNDTDELKKAIEGDGKTFGTKTKEWIKSIPATAGKTGLKIATDVATKAATDLLLQYFGIPKG